MTNFFQKLQLIKFSTMNEQQQSQLEQQRKSWNHYSGGWKKWNDFLTSIMMPVGETLIESLELNGNEHILDVASGTGEPGLTACKLLPRGKVTSIDFSEKMVAIANESARERGIRNYQSQLGEVSNMPFEDNLFDDVVCRFGMMFFPDIRSSIHEMLRVLKPGGKSAVAVWAAPEKNSFLTLLGATVSDKLAVPKPPPDTPGIFRFAKPGSLSSLFSEAGFVNVTESNVNGEIGYNSFEHFWELSSDVAGPIMELMKNEPPEAIADIKQAVFNKAKNLIKEDGKIYLAWDAVIISGEKNL